MNDRKEIISWYFYDWANSAFEATVVTVFFGPYITTLANHAADAYGFIYPLGLKVKAGSFYPYIVSLSVLCQVFFLPIFGALSDYTKMKKQFFIFFAYLGAFTTMLMYFITASNFMYGGILFLVANISFGASIVFYNSFLSDICTPDMRDSVSSKGWAIGYLGDGLLLGFNLYLFSNAGRLGLTSEQAVRICLFSAGLWWAVFSLIPVTGLKSREPAKKLDKSINVFTIGFKQLRSTFTEMLGMPQTMLFIAAYLLYNDGVQSVIVLSTQFGHEELGLTMATLTKAILIVQFVAFFGSMFFGKVAERLGAKNTIVITLAVWSMAVIYAFGFLKTEAHFYAMAVVIALVLGGSQALSRSVFSLLIPKGRESEYFSLYEISERGTSWLGPLLFGLALQFTGSYRIGILSLIVFFVAGMGILYRVNIAKAVAEANR
jgi:UMF1 family MFS transporter